MAACQGSVCASADLVCSLTCALICNLGINLKGMFRTLGYDDALDIISHWQLHAMLQDRQAVKALVCRRLCAPHCTRLSRTTRRVQGRLEVQVARSCKCLAAPQTPMGSTAATTTPQKARSVSPRARHPISSIEMIHFFKKKTVAVALPHGASSPSDSRAHTCAPAGWCRRGLVAESSSGQAA